MGFGTPKLTDNEVFAKYVDKTSSIVTGCWIWTGSKSRDGYGRVRRGEVASRWVYQILRGEIREGLELDHLCKNRICVNPDHLEPVTHKENILRGDGFAPKHKLKTHCSKGHEFTEENTYLRGKKGDGGRWCRECGRIATKKWRESVQSKGMKIPARAELKLDDTIELVIPKTHCKRGHELVGDNAIPDSRNDSWRVCRICRDENNRKYRQAQRGKK